MIHMDQACLRRTIVAPICKIDPDPLEHVRKVRVKQKLQQYKVNCRTFDLFRTYGID